MKPNFDRQRTGSWQEKVDYENAGHVEMSPPNVAVRLSPPFHIKPVLSKELQNFLDRMDKKAAKNKSFLSR